MLSRPKGYSVSERIRSIENTSELIVNQTRDLPACSILPQPTILPRGVILCCFVRDITHVRRWWWMNMDNGRMMIFRGKQKRLSTKPFRLCGKCRHTCGILFTSAVTRVQLEPRSFAHPKWTLVMLRWEWRIGIFGRKKYKTDVGMVSSDFRPLCRMLRVSQYRCKYFYEIHRQPKTYP
jgi:hypothetical protein